MANRLDVMIRLQLSDKERKTLSHINHSIFDEMTMIDFLKMVVEVAPSDEGSLSLIVAAITSRLEIIRNKGGKAYVETKQN